jgi:hypothetical protein
MKTKKIKISIRGHRIGAVVDSLNHVWISERKLNKYRLWDVAGTVEDGFAPLFEEYKII